MSETTAQKELRKPGVSNGSENKTESAVERPESARPGSEDRKDDRREQPAAEDGDAALQKRPAPSWVKPLVVGLIALAVVFGGVYGLNYWRYSQSHVSTDDAYITGNLVNVSPVISGTLLELDVDEGYTVRKGQLLARLDDAGPRATLRQALANYHAALSQIPMAQRNLVWEKRATQAAIQKAQAALAAQRERSSGARQQVGLTSETNRNQIVQAQNQVQAAQAQADQAQAQVLAAEALVENYRQAVQTAQAALANYQQQVTTAQKAAQAAISRVQSAQSEAERTAKDEQRYRVLYDQDAVSAQVYDNARAQANNAHANLQAAQAQADEAASQVEQAKASVAQAQSQVEQARKNVVQGQAQVRAAQRAADAALKQVNVTRAGLGIARANQGQVGIQQANARSTERQTGESQADISTARAGEEQVAVRRTQIETFRAQAQQAQAALTNAQISLNDTKIYAPSDGTVIKKNVNVGMSLTPGQSILTMSQGDYVWVTANFKETQLRSVRPGQSAEVEVDAFPKTVFKGRVQSVNEATGASTSLLPPDNATGNFTKVVQRIPVRIELVPASSDEDRKFARLADIKNLRQGMSVTATIETGSKGDAGRTQNASEGNPVGAGSQSAPAPMSAPGAPTTAAPTDQNITRMRSGAAGDSQAGGTGGTQASGTPPGSGGVQAPPLNGGDGRGLSGQNSPALPNPGTGPLLQDAPQNGGAVPPGRFNGGESSQSLNRSPAGTNSGRPTLPGGSSQTQIPAQGGYPSGLQGADAPGAGIGNRPGSAPVGTGQSGGSNGNGAGGRGR